MNPLSTIRTARCLGRICALALMLAATAPAFAAAPDLGRLFYTPDQRAELEAARVRGTAAASSSARQSAGGEAPPAQRYDGMVIRSDGRITRWIDGRLRQDSNAVPGLKPGQVRSGGRVYEPYQVLPAPAAPVPGEPAP